MFFHTHRHLLCTALLSILTPFYAAGNLKERIIVGGGMAAVIEAYSIYEDAKKNGDNVSITVYEKNETLSQTTVSNIVPSLTPDEILSVIPRGPELVKKMTIRFNEPGGIRVEDVPHIHATPITEHFTEQVQIYSLNEDEHAKRTQALLELGKCSMDLWLDMYNNADDELKNIFNISNFNPCGEPSHHERVLHDGYRIDLIYNVSNAYERAQAMRSDYERLGYKHCAILSPDEVVSLDPFLADFVSAHAKNNVWNQGTVALWRPGGCLDAQVFLPQLYTYLTPKMGTYINEKGEELPRFNLVMGKKVVGAEYTQQADGTLLITGLKFEDGTGEYKDATACEYVFCPGEAVGTLKKLGLCEPAYAGFAGASLLLDIEVPTQKIDEFKNFSHCMEVHQEGVVLAWQARFKNGKIFIGVAGTKAFYADQQPHKDQEFAQNRNLLQLNMINDVLPQFISIALGRDTRGVTLTSDDLTYLESQGIARRWAGVRAVAYDGFPSLGYVYKEGMRVINARCTTHLGSGGASFAPAAVKISRSVMHAQQDSFASSILHYAHSTRTAQA